MAKNRETILWYDYETTGVDPRVDRPMSFAAQRTDVELRELGEPLVVQFALAADVLPTPDACLVTGLDPDRPGTVTELDGARQILAAMQEPLTCNAGYNSIRFDDEVTRFMLWRNLLPVYDRESRNGNSRFDLIDVLRAACALRPDGMEWPVGEEGWPVFRLDALAPANGIEHLAHDALGDVRATIALARRLAGAQPDLFSYLSEARIRNVVKDRVRSFGDEPFVHTSRRFPASVRCTSLVMHVARHPRFASQILCIDLRHDPQVILDHGVDELRELLFTPRDQRAEDAPRVGVKGIHYGRCPVVAPRSVADEATMARIELDPEVCDRHAKRVADHRDAIVEKVQALYDEGPGGSVDVDQALYEGFVEDEDAAICRGVHATEPAGWRAIEREFGDERLGELLFRMRARNHPETLGLTEHARWQEVCRQKLAGADGVLARVAELRAAGADAAILDACEAAIRRRIG
jgi:exodeoxyribonuclease-1